MPTQKETIRKPETKAVKKPVKKAPAKPAAPKLTSIPAKTVDQEPVKKAQDSNKFISTIGRRKTAVARVRLFTQKKKGIVVNDKDYKAYFPTLFLQKILEDPVEKLKCQDKFGISIVVKGGGITGQAEACRHGISRALIELNPYFRKRLKKPGFLRRDPRMRERKKPGLKRARRAPQWSKR